MEAGFYRYDDDNILYGSDNIFGAGYMLLAEFKDTYNYPVEGWYWFDTPQEASTKLGFSYASLLEGEEKTIQEEAEMEMIKVTLKKLVLSSDLSEEDMAAVLLVYDTYKVGVAYKIDDMFKYQGKLYKVIQVHTSQADWFPDNTPALYTEKAPTGVIPEWVQPSGAQDAYNIGDRVVFEGNIYESLIDANVWSPIAYPAGWQLI